MGFPFLDGEQAVVNKARKEKERLDNEPLTVVWNRKLKVHFVPEHDKRQMNVLLLLRNPIPPKRPAFWSRQYVNTSELGIGRYD